MPSTFKFDRPARPEGNYVSMTDMVKLGEPVNVTEVIDDDLNMYRSEKAPRFLVKGLVGDSDEPVVVSVRKGYSRDDFLVALAEHLESTEETVPVRFVSTQGSAYIDIVTA